MALQTLPEFRYQLETITRNAPTISGIFMIYSRSRCVYVGESDDVCASLLEIYYEDNPCLNDKHLTHFSLDLVPPEARVARETERIREFGPICNLRRGSPDCGDCRYSRGTEPGRPLAVSGAPRP